VVEFVNRKLWDLVEECFVVWEGMYLERGGCLGWVGLGGLEIVGFRGLKFRSFMLDFIDWVSP